MTDKPKTFKYVEPDSYIPKEIWEKSEKEAAEKEQIQNEDRAESTGKEDAE